MITFYKGDITTHHVDAVVNAANRNLRGGGGVDGAIHRAAGPGLLAYEESVYPNGLHDRAVAVTPGFDLPVKNIIHVVGPDMRTQPDNPERDLANAYAHALITANTFKLRHVAFPAISTGVYAYPLDDAAAIALNTVNTLRYYLPEVAEIRFVLFDDTALNAFQDAA